MVFLSLTLKQDKQDKYSLALKYSEQAVQMIFFFSSRRRHTRWPRDWSQTCALPICRLVGTQDLHGAEHRPLRAPRAERRRALGDRTRQDRADTLLMTGQPSIALLDERGAEHSWLGRGQEAREAADDELGHVLAVGRQHVLAVDLDAEPRVVGQRFQLLLDIIRHPLFDHEHVTLAA